MLSPPGGKLNTDSPESPYACAAREAYEECGIKSDTRDWKLKGIVTEKNYPGIGNIMVFLFEYLKSFDELPPDIAEGKFMFIHPDNLSESNIPETDKLYIWNFVLNNNDRIFSIYIDCDTHPFSLKIENN